jgi:hypothetical protein
VFDFVGQMENCDFRGAQQQLALRYGLGMRHEAPGPSVGRSQRGRVHLEKAGWKAAAEYSMGNGVRKVRFEHLDRVQLKKGRPEKTFIWEHLAEDGTWKLGRGERPHRAYTNAAFRERDQGESVLGVESERSADSVARLRIAAFSFKEITEENAVDFAGIDLILLPDKDLAGRKLVEKKIELLRPHARRIGLITPPEEWPESGDLHDAIAGCGWTHDHVQALIALAEPIEPLSAAQKSVGRDRPKVWTLSSLRTAEFESPAPIVEDLISEGETIGLVGKPKAGKSRLGQQLALAVSRGENFLGHQVPKARLVLILDLENRAARVRTRFQKMSVGSSGDERLFIVAPETLSDMGITLATSDGIKGLQELVARVKPSLLIIDTWRLLLAGDENKTEVVVRGLRALSSLRENLPKLAILIVHHTRKTQGQDPPLLRIDASAWVENASGHYSLIAHMDACFGLEREIDRNTGDELIVFAGVSRSAAPRTLLLDEDLETLIFSTAESADVVQKLLTERERAAWLAVERMPHFTFKDVICNANTKNRKLVSSMLKKLHSMNVIERMPDGVYRTLAPGRN